MQYIFLILILILFIFIFGNNVREGFTWSTSSIQDFLLFQKTVNPQVQFNMQMIQEQASEDELSHLLKDGYWPWSDELKYLYMDGVAHNKILKINPAYSMEYVRKIYNEKAAKQLVSWNTKEGQFLLNGVKIKDGSIKCDDTNGNISMKKTVENGYNLWNGYKNIQTKDASLPDDIPGFSFIKEKCNPCLALNNDYSCPFKININGDESVSEVWSNLWNI